MKYMESSKNDTVNKAYGVRLMDAGISSKVMEILLFTSHSTSGVYAIDVLHCFTLIIHKQVHLTN